jgi:hypothetical protein
MARILQKLPKWGKTFLERTSYSNYGRLSITKLKVVIIILASVFIASEGYNMQLVYAQEPSNSNLTSDNNNFNPDTNPSSSPDPTPTIAVESSNDKPQVGESIAIAGSTTDAPTDTVTIDWGDGSQSETVNIDHNNGNWGPVEHSFNSAKRYTITASLSCANCDESINVDVQSDPTISIDPISNEKPVVGDTLSISGGTTYAQGFFVTIDWGDNSGSDRVRTDSDGNWGPVNHSFDPAKKYTITASLFCDPDNPCSVSDSRDVDVQPPHDPTPTIVIDSTSNDKPRVGESISISGSTTDAPTDTVTIDWGDGSRSETVDINHDDGNWGPVDRSFGSANKYTITASLPCANCDDSVNVDVQPLTTNPSGSNPNPNPDPNLILPPEPNVSPPIDPPTPTPPPITLPIWLIAAVIFVIVSVVVGYVIHHSKKSNYQKSHPSIEIVTQGGVEK